MRYSNSVLTIFPLPSTSTLKLGIDVSSSANSYPDTLLQLRPAPLHPFTTYTYQLFLLLTFNLCPRTSYIVMASLQLRAQRAALRSLRTPTTARCRTTRLPASFSRSYATEIEPERPNKNTPARQSNETKVGRTFQGQVMGSIGSRLRREREQREKYEEWRNMTDPTRNWMVTFGTLNHSFKDQKSNK